MSFFHFVIALEMGVVVVERWQPLRLQRPYVSICNGNRDHCQWPCRDKMRKWCPKFAMPKLRQIRQLRSVDWKGPCLLPRRNIPVRRKWRKLTELILWPLNISWLKMYCALTLLMYEFEVVGVEMQLTSFGVKSCPFLGKSSNIQQASGIIWPSPSSRAYFKNSVACEKSSELCTPQQLNWNKTHNYEIRLFRRHLEIYW